MDDTTKQQVNSDIMHLDDAEIDIVVGGDNAANEVASGIKGTYKSHRDKGHNVIHSAYKSILDGPQYGRVGADLGVRGSAAVRDGLNANKD